MTHHLVGVAEIAEIAGDRQLESPALVGSGIALAQAAGTEHVALALDLRSRHAAREFVFELPPVLGGQRGGSKERQPLDAFRVLEEVQHRQQAAPRVPAQHQPFEAEVCADRVEVGDMLSPSYRGVT